MDFFCVFIAYIFIFCASFATHLHGNLAIALIYSFVNMYRMSTCMMNTHLVCRFKRMHLAMLKCEQIYLRVYCLFVRTIKYRASLFCRILHSYASKSTMIMFNYVCWNVVFVMLLDMSTFMCLNNDNGD